MESHQKERELSNKIDVNMKTEDSGFLTTALLSPTTFPLAPGNVPNPKDIPIKAPVPPDHHNVYLLGCMAA